MKEKLFKLTVVVIIISLLTTIFVPFSVKSSQTTLTSMQDTYRGVGSTSVWKFAVNGYNNTYCANGGASLFTGAHLDDKGSFYTNSFSDITSNVSAVRWILDNMYLIEGADSGMQNDMKENIKSILKEYSLKKNQEGKSYLAIKVAGLAFDAPDGKNKGFSSLL